MRARIVTIDHDELIKILGLPEGSIISDFQRQFETQEIKIVVHSDKFFEVKKGYQIIHYRDLNEAIK